MCMHVQRIRLYYIQLYSIYIYRYLYTPGSTYMANLPKNSLGNGLCLGV